MREKILGDGGADLTGSADDESAPRHRLLGLPRSAIAPKNTGASRRQNDPV